MTSKGLRDALNRAYRLGQNYWAQADSDYTSQWKKADVTRATFEQLVEDTVSAFEEQLSSQRKPEQEPIKESSVTHSHLWIGDLYGKGKNP